MTNPASIVDTSVRAYAGVFEGTFTTIIWSHELMVLYQQLLNIWEHFGQPLHHHFTVREGTLTLTTAVLGAGQVHLTVEVRDDPMTDTTLRFKLLPEYMALARWLRTLHDVLIMFPPPVSMQPITLPPHVES